MSVKTPISLQTIKPIVERVKKVDIQIREISNHAVIDSEKQPVLKNPEWISGLIDRLTRDFSIMIIGQQSSGKSSFINSLLGRKLLKHADVPTDGVVSVLLYTNKSDGERAEKINKDGTIESLSLKDGLLFLQQQSTSINIQLKVKELRLYINHPLLKKFRIINTPGLGDLSEFEEATLKYMNSEESDLVIWTFFPDNAANIDELAAFSNVLHRRKHSVLGVVTHSLSGQEDNEDYFPYDDMALINVKNSIQSKLGDYLDEIILYDSHTTRKLKEKLDATSALLNDASFQKQLERCGYLALEDYFKRKL
ncbi:dynamin family protein [Neobacillus sp. OS1-33]|uniref:dynamin family protein n=1 Tax=Neobacillus sp. OS1-33 TaxID=3070683 RepID=UPI0027E03455|nr:dynamin family protein [Neobacillus sp. OS1-33]WML26315.1 dynamin family protein [Neobacillus sp. OS1-33]